MKKLLLTSLFATLVAFTSSAAMLVSTNLDMTTKANGVFNLTSNRCSTSTIQLANSGSAVATLSFYDMDNASYPNYGTNYTVSGSITNMITYPTNYVYSYVGYNGYTNWYTNSGTWTVPTYTANGVTNAMNPVFVFSVPGNSVASYDASAVFVRGICVQCKATTNVVATIYGKSGQ